LKIFLRSLHQLLTFKVEKRVLKEVDANLNQCLYSLRKKKEYNVNFRELNKILMLLTKKLKTI
jgi:hypothetical protein